MAKILRNFSLLLLVHLCERLMYKCSDMELVSQKYLHTKSLSKKCSNLNLIGKLWETLLKNYIQNYAQLPTLPFYQKLPGLQGSTKGTCICASAISEQTLPSSHKVKTDKGGYEDCIKRVGHNFLPGNAVLGHIIPGQDG